MKKFLILTLLISITFLTGCGLFNLNGWIMPDDLEFLAVVESLDTPEKICDYMKENFTYKEHLFYAPDPYTFWKLKEGDCNDFGDFVRFVANYHSYETYRIIIYFKNTLLCHVLTAFVEYDKYTYSNNKAYYPIYVDTFEEVVSHFFETCFEYKYKAYKVYDYENNLIEVGN